MVDDLNNSFSKLAFSPEAKNILNPTQRKALIEQGRKELNALFSQISRCEPSQGNLSESGKCNPLIHGRSSQVEEMRVFKQPIPAQSKKACKIQDQPQELEKAQSIDCSTSIFEEIMNDEVQEETKGRQSRQDTTQNSFLNTTTSMSLINHTLNPYKDNRDHDTNEFKEKIKEILSGTNYTVSNLVEIKQLRKEVANGKIELLCGRIVAIEQQVDLTNFKISDGTDEVEGCLHRDCLGSKLDPSFQIGSFILFENVHIFYPYPQHPLFLVEKANIVKIQSEKKAFSDLF